MVFGNQLPAVGVDPDRESTAFESSVVLVQTAKNGLQCSQGYVDLACLVTVTVC